MHELVVELERLYIAILYLTNGNTLLENKCQRGGSTSCQLPVCVITVLAVYTQTAKFTCTGSSA